MKKTIHSLVGIMLTSLAAMGGPAYAGDPDPLLTEKSSETFDLDMGGITLSLPIELRERAVPKKINDQQTDLSIGNIDIAYEIKDSKTGTSKVVKGWVEFEAGSTHCEVDKHLAAVRKNLQANDMKYQIKHVENTNFDGYIVTSDMATKGKLSGVYLEVYDRKISECYSVSLAVEDFDGFTRSEIKSSLSPLTDAIKKSLIAYSQKGAAQ